MVIQDGDLSTTSVRRLEEWQKDGQVKGRGRIKRTWMRVIVGDIRSLELEENLALNMEKKARIFADNFCDSSNFIHV